MTSMMQALYGGAMILIGGLKTWLHMGSVPILSLPTCNGQALEVPVGPSDWFAQAHCWGCYALAAGIIMMALAGYRALEQRRSVASITD